MSCMFASPYPIKISVQFSTANQITALNGLNVKSFSHAFFVAKNVIRPNKYVGN